MRFYCCQVYLNARTTVLRGVGGYFCDHILQKVKVLSGIYLDETGN